MQRRSKLKRPLLPVAAIVGDGYGEQIYFQQVKESMGTTHLLIRPELPNRSGRGGGFNRVFKKAKVLKEEGCDHVFCLVDMDVVYRERNLSAYQTEKKRLEKQGVTIIESNPCFEVWFLLHFLRTSRLFDDCADVERILRQETDLTDYSKDQKYIVKLSQVLWLRLREHALPNAMWLENQQEKDKSANFPRCEVFRIFEVLKIALAHQPSR